MSFFAWLSGSRSKPASSSGTPPDVIVADFGEVWATRGPGLCTVADVKELPYPKDEIKRAILVMLLVTDDLKLREHLKAAYVSLAHWQVDVGPTHQGLDPTSLVKTTRETLLDPSKSFHELLKDTVARTEEMEKWQPIVQAEEEALINELRQLHFW
jgi:hypothetical protein